MKVKQGKREKRNLASLEGTLITMSIESSKRDYYIYSLMCVSLELTK